MIKAFFIPPIPISSTMAMTKTEKLSQVVLVIIALSAVLVSVWQGRISQKQLEISQEHNRMTVRPYFDLSPGTISSNSEQEFYLQLTNHGYGLGIIKAFEISVDGQLVPNWNAALNKLGVEGQMRQAANLKPNDFFAPGKERRLVTIGSYTGEGRVKLKIVYQSIYEERFEKEVTF